MNGVKQKKLGIQNVGFWDYKGAQVDGTIMEEGLNFLALGIPKAWQSSVTGWRSVNANFKLGRKENKRKKIKAHNDSCHLLHRKQNGRCQAQDLSKLWAVVLKQVADTSFLASSNAEVESRDPNKYGALFASFLDWPIRVAAVSRHLLPPSTFWTGFVTWLSSNMAALEALLIWAPGAGECNVPQRRRERSPRPR